MVSDNIAFKLLLENNYVYIKAILLNKRFYYAKIGFATHEVLETNMPKNILDRTIGAFKRNYKLLWNEMKER